MLLRQIACNFVAFATPSSFLDVKAHTSTLYSTGHNDDLWKAGAPVNEWKSSLPLPENTLDNPLLTERARSAMAGRNPPALEGRSNVNLEGFNGQIKWLHVDPPVLTVDNFLSYNECDEILKLQSVSLPPGEKYITLQVQTPPVFSQVLH